MMFSDSAVNIMNVCNCCCFCCVLHVVIMNQDESEVTLNSGVLMET